jgi:hypothetical protein
LTNTRLPNRSADTGNFNLKLYKEWDGSTLSKQILANEDKLLIAEGDLNPGQLANAGVIDFEETVKII